MILMKLSRTQSRLLRLFSVFLFRNPHFHVVVVVVILGGGLLLQISILEIYNETVRDLLTDAADPRERSIVYGAASVDTAAGGGAAASTATRLSARSPSRGSGGGVRASSLTRAPSSSSVLASPSGGGSGSVGSSSGGKSAGGSSSSGGGLLKVREDPKQGPYVEGLIRASVARCFCRALGGLFVHLLPPLNRLKSYAVVCLAVPPICFSSCVEGWRRAQRQR